MLRPKKVVPRDQGWFWTNRWQAAEKTAQKDLESGRVTEAPSIKELPMKLKR